MSDMVSSLNKMSHVGDMRALDISGKSGDVEVSTEWPGMDVVMVLNAGASSATLIVKTRANPTTSLTIPIDSHVNTPRLAPIKTIVKTGTSDSLVVFLQRKE